ncbi:conserved hypothetical protein [uncultured phage]|nr:conserved hypothetical protein [uncultured phage]
MEIKISTDELRKRKLFVSAPMYGGQCAGMFIRSVADLSALCTQYGVQLQFYFLFNESLITRARNYCADEFLRSNATHMMFIDSDIGFSAQDVIAMLALMGDETEYDVMCGPYPKKCISWEKIKQAVDKGVADRDPNVLERYVGDYVFNPKSGQNEIPINQPVEVREGGTGFMMIRRSTFETLEKAYPSLSYKPDHVRTEAFDGSREIHAYFDCVIDRGYTFDDVHRLMEDLADPGRDKTDLGDRARAMLEAEKTSSKRYLSEDYMFCYYAQKAGLKVWLNPWMKLQHVGSYVFGGSLADLASIGASATADIEKIKKK